MWHKTNWSVTGLNSQFSFAICCLTKPKELSLPCYLPIAGRRIVRCVPFPRVLALSEMHTVSSRIWSRVNIYIYILSSTDRPVSFYQNPSVWLDKLYIYIYISKVGDSKALFSIATTPRCRERRYFFPCIYIYIYIYVCIYIYDK